MLHIIKARFTKKIMKITKSSYLLDMDIGFLDARGMSERHYIRIASLGRSRTASNLYLRPGLLM